MQQSTLPCLMSIWPSWYYDWNKQESVLRLKDGRTIYLRTATDPNAAEGIQNVAAIWIDEAGMCSKLFWYNLESRTAFKQAQILATSTPYAMNWVKKEIIDGYEKHKRPDICYRRWRSIDNPAFPKEEYERQRQILPANIFRRKYEGIHEKMEGLVWEVGEDNYCTPFTLPKGTRTFAGVDWGYKHAYAIVIRAITPDGYRYDISEFKQSGLDPSEKIAVARAKQSVYGIEHWCCGPDRPEMIDAFNDAGLKASSFYYQKDSKYREIMPGIELHAEMVKSKLYKVFSDTCPHLEDEYESYHWPEEVEDKTQKEVPVPIDDDLMSAVRYVSVGSLHVYPPSVIHKLKDPVRAANRDIWKPTQRSQGRPWNAY